MSRNLGHSYDEHHLRPRLRTCEGPPARGLRRNGFSKRLMCSQLNEYTATRTVIGK